MINTDLKTRAKRLRVAVKNVLGAEITNSQALELVAQEENFPTWDAASACYENRIRAHAGQIKREGAMTKKRVVIELDRLSVPLVKALGRAMVLDPDEIEVVGKISTIDFQEALEHVHRTGHVLLTGDMRRPSDGVDVIVLA